MNDEREVKAAVAAVGLDSPEGGGQDVPAVERVDGYSGVQLASVAAEDGAPVGEHHVSLKRTRPA